MHADRILEFADRQVPLVVRRTRRARRMTLTADPAMGTVRLTLPPGVSERSGDRFLQSRMDWLADRITRFPAPRPFRDGGSFPLEDSPIRIAWAPDGRRTPALDGAVLHGGGPPEFLPKRIETWLRAEAKRRILIDIDRFGLPGVQSVSVRDTRRQWGSCAVGGRLSFSWRLVMAPAEVRRAVVAHELAHLAHRNHGPAFRREAERILGGSHAAANAWLRANGARLHWIGREEFARSA